MILVGAAARAQVPVSPSPPPAPSVALCAPAPHDPPPVAIGTAQWNGWGRDVDNTRYQPEPALRAADVPKLALKWAVPLGAAASYGQPTVVGGRVFVTISSGRTYALDARRGCAYWTFDAGARVDTPIVVGELGRPKLVKPRWRRWRRHNAHIEVIEPPSAVLFGDAAGTVYALDADTGAQLWKTALAGVGSAAVSAAPVVYEGRVYVPLREGQDPQHAQGAVAALDLASGAVAWRAAIAPAAIETDRGTAILAPPTVDARREALYVAAGRDGAIVALNLADGKPRWVAQPPSAEPAAAASAATDTATAADSAAADSAPPAAAAGIPGPRLRDNPPILQTLPNGRQLLLSASPGGVAFALDPERNGALVWHTRVLAGADDVAWSHAADHRNVYVSAADVRSVDGRPRGVLAALDIADGQIRWLKPSPQPACAADSATCGRADAHAITVMPGIVFGGTIDGHLRAYSTIDGMQLWDYDTAQDFHAANGGVGRGGELGSGGATVVGGMVYLATTTGGGPPGGSGALLAFSVAAK